MLEEFIATYGNGDTEHRQKDEDECEICVCRCHDKGQERKI